MSAATSMVKQQVNDIDFSALESVLALGDLSKLTAKSRVDYYRGLCESLGLNSLSRPFDYISLQGKLTLYAKKDCTDQLRRIYGVSVDDLSEEIRDGLLIVKCRVSMPNGRKDADFGAVPFENLKGETRANAMLKCVTKAKRRATLSICGLGMLDESEIESVAGAQRVRVDHSTGEIVDSPAGPSVRKADSFTSPGEAFVGPDDTARVSMDRMLHYSVLMKGCSTSKAARKVLKDAHADRSLPLSEERTAMLVNMEKTCEQLKAREKAGQPTAIAEHLRGDAPDPDPHNDMNDSADAIAYEAYIANVGDR